jgi:hypothetical protein
MTKKTSNKPVYISLTLDELAALEAFGFRERWAYIAFKRIANFKTGVAGRFRYQHLTYVELAKHVRPPPGVQGRGQGAIDDTQARDILLALEQAGLVANIGRREDNGGLCFELPLSPIGAKKAPPATPATQPSCPPAGKVQQIFPDEEPPQISAKPEPVPLPAHLHDSLSVMINKEIHINTERANLGTAEVAQCRANGAARPLEKTDLDAGASAAALSAAEIEQTLRDCWNFKDVGTPASLARYEAWAQAGITRLDLEVAMGLTEPEGDEVLTPADLEGHLWPTADGGQHRLAA